MTERGPEIAAGVHEGDILAGKYRVDRLLGTGGMGVVVAARHVQLQTSVALKFLGADMLGSGEALGRFEREARAVAKILSEHVARVIDVGTLENGAPFMVMELLDGWDLSHWLQVRGPLDVELAVELVLQACEAIAEAHSLGIVHRDLKPANLFCVRRPDGLPYVKVLDFGISKFSALSSSRREMAMTRTAMALGSPFYMSPEQMESARDVDHRTDIWALGIVLYELLVGEPPFQGASLPEVCMKIATKAPPPLRSVRHDVPPGLETVVIRCIQKERAKRYGDVGALATALKPFGPERARASVDRVVRTLKPSAESPLWARPPESKAPDSGDPGVGYGRSETIAALGGTKSGGKPPGRSHAFYAALGALAGVVLLTAFAAISGASKAPAVVAAKVEAPKVGPPGATGARSRVVVASPPVANLGATESTDGEAPVSNAFRAEPAPRGSVHLRAPAHPTPIATPASKTPPSPSATPTPSAASPLPAGSRETDPFSRLQPF